MHRFGFTLVALLSTAMLFSACTSSNPDVDTTAESGPSPVSPTESSVISATSTPGSAPAPNPTSTATGAVTPTTTNSVAPPTEAPAQVLSDVRLPTRPVRFQVEVPANTPPSDDVYVTIFSVDSQFGQQHVRLDPTGDPLMFAGEVDLPSGGLVRYAYDRWDEVGCCADAEAKREALFTGDHAAFRYMIADDVQVPDVMLVRDVVAQWKDLPSEFTQTDVTGRIVDSETSEPLMDIDVSVGGVHVATDFDGRFVVPGIVPGPHRLVAMSMTGGFAAIEQEIEVGESGLVLGAEIVMSRTRTVPVEFSVQLPVGTPSDTGVFLAGNLWQIGARPGGPNRPAIPSGISMPQMQREGDVATLTLDLPEDEYVEYFYTLGSDVAAEVANFNRVFRSFKVEPGINRSDSVKWWGNEGWPLLTLRVDVPSNTPPGVPVYLRNGPTYRMNRISPTQWVTTVGSHPPGSEYRFSVSLGDDIGGQDGSPGLDSDGNRSITVPQESGEHIVTVSKWKHLPDPTDRDSDGSLMVEFRLSVPPDTPEGASIVLTGNRPALGANGTMMEPVPGNPWLYAAKVSFGHDGDLRYRYTIQESGTSSPEFEVFTGHHGQEVNDYVVSWDTAAPEPRDEWVSGLFMPDFWSESFLPISDSAFNAGLDAGGEWVAISSVWSFGTIMPEPYLESRPVRIWSVLTPLEDIRAQAAIAREKGLKIFLAPQMNPEVHPNWQDETVSAGSREWWQQWLEQAEAQWMWNAVVAEEIGAEMLMLPGYVFHVFPPPGFFHEPGYADEFDLKVQDMILKVRAVYSGKIMISGSQTEYDFPGLADYVGVTTYDIGTPELPASASVAELIEDFEPRFAERVDARWERWGKPVMMYTIHADSKSQPGDEHGQLYQAAAHEALFHLISARPWLAGSFSWAFDYSGTWELETHSVRDRAAGAVMAKWYALLSGSHSR